MAVTVASFKVRYPEFVEASDAFVAACLADATLKCNADAWGDNYDQAVSLQLAHILALSPFGMGLQLSVRHQAERADTSDLGSTVYEQQLIELRSSNVMGLSVG